MRIAMMKRAAEALTFFCAAFFLAAVARSVDLDALGILKASSEPSASYQGQCVPPLGPAKSRTSPILNRAIRQPLQEGIFQAGQKTGKSNHL